MKQNPYPAILRIALAALLIATAAACSDDDPGDAPVPGTDGTNPDATNLVTVRFGSGDDATPETRTTIDGNDVLWTTGDEIGISAVRTDGTGTKVENKLYNPANAAANSTFTPTDGAEMQLNNGSTYTFTSYYPYNESNATADKATGISVNEMTQTDGTTSDHIGPKDFMWAREENVRISGTESPQVSFNYKHIFPMLVFSLDKAEGKEVKSISVRSVDGTTPVRGKVDVSLADGKIEQVTSGYYYTSLTFTTPMAEGGTGRLLILPQAAGAELIVGILTTDNVLYEYTKTAANALEGGKSYTFTFNLTEEAPNRTVYTAAGTNTDWQIADESGLRGFALAVHYYGQDKANATLTADVTLSAYATWEEPIGIANVSYSGTFNGDGYTISDLAIDRTSGANVGLFGYLNNAKVRNLRVTGSVTAGASQYVGGIAGLVVGNNAVIENCLFAGTVTGSSFVGGIAGQNNSKITACFSSGSVTAKSSTVGGIVGYNDGSKATITHSYSSAAVTTEESYAGGIVGSNTRGGKVTSCYATGTVTALKQAGGIAGSNSGIDASIENCLAFGSKIARFSGNAETFGRIAGGSTNGGTITNCAAYSGMIVIDRSIAPSSNGTTINGAGLTKGDCITDGNPTTPGTYQSRGFTTPDWGFDTPTWNYLPWLKVLDDMWPPTSATDHPARIAVPDHLSSPVIP